MQLNPGDQLGPYQVTGLVGKGGMGEVYRATDTRLNRSVAIKTSNREFNDRFEREAHAIAALNHPNICTLHDVGPNYLVMEFVDGELLSKIIERGPLPLDKALAYATQIASALAAAHDKGVIHRDLKPGNIIVTSNGAKVLDFGLAKLSEERLPSDSNAETATAPLTKAGAILGTLYYMAPEQVQGKEAGERSDIFSFGVCAYEMITGQHPFTGETQAEVLAAILKDQPTPMTQRQPAMPRALERIVRRCLEKKPDDRWRSADALKGALETIDLDAVPLNTTSTGSPLSGPITAPIPTTSQGRKWIWPAVAAVLLAGLGIAGWSMWSKPTAPVTATRFQVEPPPGVQFETYVSVSPNGRKLLFTASGNNQGLWIRDLDSLQWHRLPGTDATVPIGPGWSPDGKFISFSTGSELKKVALDGGPPITLCKSPGFEIGTSTWTPDGSTIVFGGRGQGDLYRVPSAGGIPERITVVDREHGETFSALASFLPDGKHFLYLRGGAPDFTGVYIGSLDTKPEEQKKNRRLVQGPVAVPYANGRIFIWRQGTLLAQTFDADKLETVGEPFPVAENIPRRQSTAIFSVSSAGTLAYLQTGEAQNAAANWTTAWYERAGKQTSRLEAQNQDVQFRLSPDARRAVSLNLVNGAADSLWMNDFARGVRTRLTFEQTQAQSAVWSPNGARVYYRVGGQIFAKDANGAGDARQLLQSPTGGVNTSSVSPDGKYLLFQYLGPGGANDLALAPLDGEAKLIPLLQTQANERLGSFSPDGRWIAYYSDESGRNHVYVRPFVENGSKGPVVGEGKWQISPTEATVANSEFPRWTKNGREIVFRNGPEFHAVAVSSSGGVLQPGQDTTLFRLAARTWDVTADGEKFLITTDPGAAVAAAQGDPAAAQAAITVVLNWDAALKK